MPNNTPDNEHHAADTSQNPLQDFVNTMATDEQKEARSKNETPKINTDNAQNDYKPNPIKCFFNMYRYAFTMKARTGRREFFIAAGIHFGLLLALSIFAYNNMDRNCQGDGSMGCVIFYAFILPVLIFIVQYIPFTSMLIRRCLDGDKCNSEDDYKTNLFRYYIIYYFLPLIIPLILTLILFLLSPILESDLLAGAFEELPESIMLITLIAYACFILIFTLYKVFKPSYPNGLLKRI